MNNGSREDSSVPSSSSTSPVTSELEQQGQMEIFQRINEILQDNSAEENMPQENGKLLLPIV
jgi:hypothetical protein